MDRSIKEDIYLDFPIIKQTNSNGELKTYKNSDALFQAIKIWLTCEKGEKIRTNSGGYLLPYIGKFLDEDTAEQIRSYIREGLTTEFFPPLTIVQLDVIPDKKTNSWCIKIAGYNSDLAIGVNDYVVVTNSI